MNATFEAYDVVREERIQREDIEECSDLPKLCEMYDKLQERAVEIKSFLSAFSDAEIDDEAWFRKAGGALAYREIARRWVEKRILLLGGSPPYWPTDPRTRQLRILNEKVERLQNRVRELEGRA